MEAVEADAVGDLWKAFKFLLALEGPAGWIKSVKGRVIIEAIFQSSSVNL